jgi:DUF2950 family protein
MTQVRESRFNRRLAKSGTCSIAAVMLFLMNPLPAAWAASGQQMFDRPEMAVDALLTDLKNRDVDGLAKLFGPEQWGELVGPDKAQAREGLENIYEAAQVSKMLVDGADGHKILIIGAQGWPFPIPLTLDHGQWRFDTEAGIQEVINRRIGRDELNAIAALREYVHAQQVYASVDRSGNGVLKYAQRVNSTPGTHDGLYWPSKDADDESPLGGFVAESADYLEGRTAGDPFKGYYFKVLTRQGAGAPGGRYDYIINGNMIGGFAMIAYPADYGNSGIMSFIVNQQGIVFERDLGDDTATIAQSITEYDPTGWAESKD